MKPENPNDIQCSVCGYYCLGKGGFGCIDKPKLCEEYNNMATGGKKKLYGFMHRSSHEIALIIQGEILIFNDATYENGSAIEYMFGKFIWDFLKFFEFMISDGNEQHIK